MQVSSPGVKNSADMGMNMENLVCGIIGGFLLQSRYQL